MGSIVGLGAMGLTLTYGILKFANFAHGDLMSLGMFLAFFVVVDLGLAGADVGPFSFGWGMLPAALFAMGGVALVTVGLERAVFRPLRRRGSGIITLAIASLGLGIMLRAIVQMVWGPGAERYATGIQRATTIFWDLKVKPDQFFIVGVTLALTIAHLPAAPPHAPRQGDARHRRQRRPRRRQRHRYGAHPAWPRGRSAAR